METNYSVFGECFGSTMHKGYQVWLKPDEWGTDDSEPAETDIPTPAESEEQTISRAAGTVATGTTVTPAGVGTLGDHKDSSSDPGTSLAAAVGSPLPGRGLPDQRHDYSRLRSLIAEFLEYLPSEREFAESSLETYRREINRFLFWIEQNPEPINPGTFTRYKSSLRKTYSPATINLSLIAIKRFLAWLCDIGILPYNPAERVIGITERGRKTKHKRDPLSSDQARRLLDSVGNQTPGDRRDKAIIASMLYGGLRTIEINRVRINDYRVRMEYRVLEVQGKGRLESDKEGIVITEEWEHLLTDWLAVHPNRTDPNAPLFCSLSQRNKAGEMSLSAIRAMVKKRFSAAGIVGMKQSTHSLRHTAITAVIAGGGSLLDAQRFARHGSPLTTQIYIHEFDRFTNPPERLIKY